MFDFTYYFIWIYQPLVTADKEINMKLVDTAESILNCIY